MSSFRVPILAECFLPVCLWLWQTQDLMDDVREMTRFASPLVLFWIATRVTTLTDDISLDAVWSGALLYSIWKCNYPQKLPKGIIVVMAWHLEHVLIFYVFPSESANVFYLATCSAIFSMVALGGLRQQSLKQESLFTTVPVRGAEYDDVEKQVLKHTSKVHRWTPEVTKIEKVVNPALAARFESAANRTHGKYVTKKFHGTINSSLNSICGEGFRLPSHNYGMFGKGIYFATHSSKSAQYTGGSNKLLLCSVLLGKSKMVTFSNSNLSLESLKSEGYDSVFAPGEKPLGVLHDEYVVYDPDQALPEYIIHYRSK